MTYREIKTFEVLCDSCYGVAGEDKNWGKPNEHKYLNRAETSAGIRYYCDKCIKKTKSIESTKENREMSKKPVLTDQAIDEEQTLLSVESFFEKILDDLGHFVVNMNMLGNRKASYPEWYETFGAWSEVGTDMEEEFYGKRKE
jgi:hypothetical protein